MGFINFNPFVPGSAEWWAWKDWADYVFAGILAVIVLGWYMYYRSRHKRVGPVTMLSEFDKSGLIHAYNIEQEYEGTSFLMFERENGDVEYRQIGQPFTFVLDDENIERNHFNPRGSHQCLDPQKLFSDYVPKADEKNVIVNEITQHFRSLRTGGYDFNSLRAHTRTFILIGILGGMIGFGLAAFFSHRPPV